MVVFPLEGFHSSLELLELVCPPAHVEHLVVPSVLEFQEISHLGELDYSTYIINVISVHLFEARCWERHSQDAVCYVCDIKIIFGVLEPPSLSTCDFANKVHYISFIFVISQSSL